MANPTTFAEQNFTFKGDGKEVGDLPCFVNNEMTISCWKLTQEEIAEINRTGIVYLGQCNYGRALQPQGIYPMNPFAPADVVPS